MSFGPESWTPLETLCGRSFAVATLPQVNGSALQPFRSRWGGYSYVTVQFHFEPDWSAETNFFIDAVTLAFCATSPGGAAEPEPTLPPPPTPQGYPPLPTPTPIQGYPPPPSPSPTPHTLPTAVVKPSPMPPDMEAPSSNVAALPAYQTEDSFSVFWDGADPGGSGIANYDVQYRDGTGGLWTDWLLYTEQTDARFVGVQDGHTYYFRSRARDHAGNLEGWPTNPDYDAFTTVDLTAPSSQVGSLPTYSKAQFIASWSGYDATSGVADYDVQVCQGECPAPQQSAWHDWLTGTTTMAASYTGEHGQTCHFRSRARDHAGNEELYPAGGDAWTIVDAHPPSTTVKPLDRYTFTTTFTVTWHGADDLSGLAHYDIYYRDESLADWVLWLEEVTITQATFLGSPGHTYHFCSRGVDNAGNAENCPPACITGDQCGWPIQGDAQIGIAPWSRVDGLPPYTVQTTFPVCWSGLDEQWYDVYVRDGLYGAWVKWKKNTSLICDSYTGAYGHIYYFYSVGKSGQGEEEPPYDWDAYTKLVAPTEGEGAAGGSGALVLLPPDEAPDRMEEVTRTQAIGTPLTGYIAPAGDVDWYRFALTATMRLRIRLDELPADFDVYVFDGTGRFRGASTWGHTWPEEVVVRVPAGVYYVRLAGYAGDWSGASPYRLLVERTGGGP